MVELQGLVGDKESTVIDLTSQLDEAKKAVDEEAERCVCTSECVYV